MPHSIGLSDRCKSTQTSCSAHRWGIAFSRATACRARRHPQVPRRFRAPETDGNQLAEVAHSLPVSAPDGNFAGFYPLAGAHLLRIASHRVGPHLPADGYMPHPGTSSGRRGERPQVHRYPLIGPAYVSSTSATLRRPPAGSAGGWLPRCSSLNSVVSAAMEENSTVCWDTPAQRG